MSKKDSLIDLFVHDLTGPLSIVSTCVHSLLDKQDRYGAVTERQNATLKMALRNVNKAQTFLREMIEIYRSEEGLFRHELCSIRDILRESVMDAMEIVDPAGAEKLCCNGGDGEFRSLLEGNGVFIDLTGRFSAAPFCHDEKKIQQILRNLISNALKYRREKVSISITGDEELVITVADDGPGIPQEKQSSVFKRFSGMKEKDVANVTGLGFGLSCVKAIVETMNGSVTLASEKGKGTCFVVRIPPLQGN
jgi:signal transduction histidine kinase